MSMRGNRFSPLVTVTVPGSRPQVPASSQPVRSAPIWAKIFPQVSGMKGVSRMAQMRTASSRLYSTRASRGLSSWVLASTQGAFSSIYLLAREITSKISTRAVWKVYSSMSPWYFSFRPPARAISSASFSSSARWSAGRVPPKYFTAMAVVRLTKLPKSLARSMLMRLMRLSLEKLPSLPKGNSRSR